MPDKPDQYFLEWNILSAKNDAVDDLNQVILDLFPGEEKILQSADKVTQAENQHYPIEFLNPIKVSGLPLHIWPCQNLDVLSCFLEIWIHRMASVMVPG